MSGESLPSGVLKVAEEAKAMIRSLRESESSGDAWAWNVLGACNRIDELAALASPPPQATGALSDTQVIAMNPYLNDEGRRALWLAAFRFAERHHGITAASQVEPEEKHG